MIRYPVTRSRLRQLIETEKSGWLGRAGERTDRFRQKGKYEESSSIWSEVKAVYMKLQGESKCAYCERKMAAVEYGRSEQDVEHFRPKGNVKFWKAPSSLTDAGIAFTDVPDDAKGYFLLPYHIFNYAAACKPCNSALKSDYFPIAGTYDLDADDPEDLADEQPYLIYPIGSLDDDPETLIKFHGTSPQPVAASGFSRHRALVTIEFFKLDDTEGRKDLFRDRALIILALFSLLQKTKHGTAAEKAVARSRVNGFLKPKLRHLNCARCFKKLFDTDVSAAQAMRDAAVELITSVS